MDNYIPGTGPLGAKILLLGDSPTPDDFKTGKPFSGHVGNELTHLLREAGIHKDNCWLTYAVKSIVRPNIKGSKKIPLGVRCKLDNISYESNISDLRNEIESIKPNVIIPFGGDALYSVYSKSNINEMRGSILYNIGSKIVPTYHPRDLSWQAVCPEFIGYWNKHLIVHDLKRANYQSSFSELVLPRRTLEICKSSSQFSRFLDQYKQYDKVTVDIEAGRNCLPICIGFSFTPLHGITVPLWNCEGISTLSDGEMTQLWIMMAQVLGERKIVGQNFNYDRDKVFRLGFKVGKLYSDTLLKSFCIDPELPKKLSVSQSIYTEEPFYKDEGMYDGTLEDLFTGCARDACVTNEIDIAQEQVLERLELKDFYYNFLMQLPDFYLDIEREGFAIDHEERNRLLKKYIEWDEKIRYRLYQLTGVEVNTGSPKQVALLLFDILKLPRRAGTGEEELTALLNLSSFKNKEHREVVELVLENRRVRKSVSTYMLALPDFDGRMRTTYYPALETGRSSTGQQDPPIRPTIQVTDENGKKKKKVLGIAFQTMTKHGDIGADIRGQYVPDKGEIFVNADSSQAEARVVWLLADDEEALRLVDETDYHALTATWFFGHNKELCDYSKKLLGYEHPIRFVGKTLRHAGHLGAGKKRASIEVNTQARKYNIPIQIDEATADRALKIFHSKQPRIQQVFQNGISEILKNTRKLIAPVPYGIDSKIGGVRTFYERYGEELFRQGYSYIPQRAVSDNVKAAGMRIKKKIKNIKIIVEAHDALLFGIPERHLLEWCEIIKEEFEKPIRFDSCSLPRRDLVIPCEIETGYNYKDLSKFKHEFVNVNKITLQPQTITEKFMIKGISLPKDTKKDEDIYNALERKGQI
jgi:uracil-DNA glycosylase family 4